MGKPCVLLSSPGIINAERVRGFGGTCGGARETSLSGDAVILLSSNPRSASRAIRANVIHASSGLPSST